jgi:hypothetical protein
LRDARKRQQRPTPLTHHAAIVRCHRDANEPVGVPIAPKHSRHSRTLRAERLDRCHDAEAFFDRLARGKAEVLAVAAGDDLHALR